MTRKFKPRPDQVKVGHRTYQISWLHDDQWPKAGLDPERRGETHNVPGMIYMRLDHQGVDCDEMSLRETLLHEVMHACSSVSMIWNVWDVLDHKEARDFAVVEELLIGAQAPVLIQVLHDNPMFAEYILDNQEH